LISVVAFVVASNGVLLCSEFEHGERRDVHGWTPSAWW